MLPVVGIAAVMGKYRNVLLDCCVFYPSRDSTLK